MGNSLGRRTIGATGSPLFLSYDGQPHYKAGGWTIDWASVSAVSADTVTEDGQTVLSGKKYLPLGQVMYIDTVAEKQTVTITGTPTGGTFTLSLTRGGVTKVTSAIPYNATAAQVQAALESLSSIGPGGVVVTGGPGPGTAFTVVFNFNEDVAALVKDATGLTGGSSPDVTVATTATGTATLGKAKPASNSTTLVNGRTFVTNRVVLEDEEMSDHAGAPINGGRVFAARLKVGGATQPTLANLLAACPLLVPINDV